MAAGFADTRLCDSNRENIAHVPYFRDYYLKAINSALHTVIEHVRSNTNHSQERHGKTIE
jgi:hypothetical protein